jgi:hypothetical protein
MEEDMDFKKHLLQAWELTLKFIVLGFQGFLDLFENVVDQGLGLMFGEAHLIVEGVNQVFFYEGHEGS